MKLLPVVILFLILPACRRPTPADLLAHRKVDDWQKARALDVVNNLRGAFNEGVCQPIYNDAAGFFKAEELEDWLDDCHNLRSALGQWKGFEFKSAERCGKPEYVVCMAGSAEFEKERTEIRIAVQLNPDGDKLRSLSIVQRNRRWTQSPHWSYPIRRPSTDPLPKKSPKSGLAS